LAREGTMFIKDKAKRSSRVGGVKWRVVYCGKLVFESDEQEFSLRGVNSVSLIPSACHKLRVYQNG